MSTGPVAPATSAALPATEVDHLVVAAATLEQGAQWCEATFGVPPGPGGKHAGFGTHNRLAKIDSERFPRTYLEIIALDPEAPPPTRPRWFGLDSPAMQARLAQQGPRLVHVVARTTALDARLAALASALTSSLEATPDLAVAPVAAPPSSLPRRIELGVPIAASRQSPHGLLRWRIVLRPDGALLFGGALPTLIEWNGAHPTDAMAASRLRLRLHGLALAGLPAAAAAALGLRGVQFVAQSRAADTPALRAEFETPRGVVTLESA